MWLHWILTGAGTRTDANSQVWKVRPNKARKWQKKIEKQNLLLSSASQFFPLSHAGVSVFRCSKNCLHQYIERGYTGVA